MQLTKIDTVKPRSAGRPDNVPNIGDWYWVKVREDADGEDQKKEVEHLFCVSHLASNHVQFKRRVLSSSSTVCVRYRDLLAETRLEPNWKAIIEQQIEQKKIELQQAVAALTDAVQSAGLISSESEKTLLPSVTRRDPADSKKQLLKLKEKTYPALHDQVEYITQQITALHRGLMLPMSIQSDRMGKAVELVDERLFALELYAGLFQGTLEIRKGKPADPETPIAVRQMLRYMDEECLIDYGTGGMNFHKLEEFDEWIAQDEHLNRIAPEPRCVVALQIRRHDKNYGEVRSFADAWRFCQMNKANAFTYLLIRNGECVSRLWAEIEFKPRLLPLREEFIKPFETKRFDWDKRQEVVDQTITPDHLDYDEHVAERKKKIYQYNSVMFLLQGLLDRSKVFSPHPKINLGDDDHIARYFKPVYDEETGLPSSHPPSWENYVLACNSQIVKGSHVWSNHYEESDYEYRRHYDRHVLRSGRQRPDICKVDRISKDRKKVRVSWPWGTRYGRQFPDRWHNRGDWGEWPVDKERHAWLPIEKVFNVSAYKPGDYKQFLCDAYLKGAYLKWAPQLLDAEKWKNENKKTCKHKDR